MPDDSKNKTPKDQHTNTEVTQAIGVGHHAESMPLPEMIGHYRIIRQIGQGGMGAVYEAEQESPKRRVALKVIKAGAISGNLLRRFEIEAQILGKLDHPGIATIYEAGTFGSGADAQPFFAMEYVEGELLTEYVFGRKLGTRERLGLIAKIADAVQHAHQKGVIHRDLKPGNILVTKDGQIKILDFGVARATDADIQTATMQTDIGQLIGTIPYMSPEQASGDPDELDTRSDVYALGIVAYELLTGLLPYDVERKMIHEAVRVIREDTPRPLSSINRTFRGDIEIIIGKALVKEKDRRYQSASGFASDIHRYLNSEPIEARPPSTWYQLAKFSKRNKALVAGVIAVLIVSVVGALVSVSFAMGEAEQKHIAIQATASEALQRQAAVARADEAEAARVRAQAAEAETSLRAQELEQVAEFQSSQLSGIDVKKMGDMLRHALIEAVSEEQRSDAEQAVAGVNFTSLALGTLEENIFVRSIRAVDEEFDDQPLVQARLLQTIADTALELGLLELALDPQKRALAVRRRSLGDDHPDTLTSISNMGVLLRSQGKLSEAEPYYREALASRRRVLGDDHPDTLTSINNMGVLLRSQVKLDEAVPYYYEALASRRRVLGDDHPDTLNSINNMGVLLRSQGKLGEAEPYYREALATKRRVLGDDHPATLTSINNMGFLLQSQGKLDEAEPYWREGLASSRRVLGDDHPATLTSINNMGILLGSQGKLDEAELYYREGLASSRRVLGDDHPGTLTSIANMGALLLSQGKLDEAEPYFREGLATSRRVLGDDHPDTMTSIINIGFLLFSQGKFDEAEPYFREALATSRRVLGDDHPKTLDRMRIMGDLLDKQSRWPESEEIRRRLVDSARRIEPEGGTRLGSTLVILGLNLIEQDRYADAEPVLAECLEIRQRVLPEGHWLIWNTQSLFGETLAKQSKFVEAEGVLVEAAEEIEPPEQYRVLRVGEAIGRVVDLYAAWDEAEPDGGYGAHAEAWRVKLDAINDEVEPGAED